ncbi:ComEC/Rec2 family competence protein [Halosimplex aquaticum]
MTGKKSKLPKTDEGIGDPDDIVKKAIDEVYTAKANFETTRLEKSGSKPEVSDPSGYDTKLRDWYDKKSSARVTNFERTYETGTSSNPRQRTYYTATVEVDKQYKEKERWRKCADKADTNGDGTEECVDWKQKTFSKGWKTVTYTMSFEIKGARSMAADVTAKGLTKEFETGGSPDYKGTTPTNFEGLPQQSAEKVSTISPGGKLTKSDVRSAITASSVGSKSALENQLRQKSSARWDVSPADQGKLRNWLAEDIKNHVYPKILKDFDPIEMKLRQDGDVVEPVPEVPDQARQAERGYIYEHASGSEYGNAADLARAEARHLYIAQIENWINDINKRRQSSKDKANGHLQSELGIDSIGNGLSNAKEFIGGATPKLTMSDPAKMNTELMGDITYRVKGSPTMLTMKPVNSQTVPAVRPAGEGPSDPENTMHAPFASKVEGGPMPGLPIAPIPGYWFLSVNAWNVRMQGEYARFAVTARTGDPSGTKPVTYVRQEQAVYLEINGVDRRAGTVQPISFDNGVPIVVAMPGGTVMPSGSLGTGERFGSSGKKAAKHQLKECSSTWTYTGPGFTPFKRTPSDSGGKHGDKYKCYNQKKKANTGGLKLTGVSSKSTTASSALKTAADMVDDKFENLAAGPMCPVAEEDMDFPAPSARASSTGSDDDPEQEDGCPDKNMTVRFIDMGKGTSILLEAPNGETMLIDAGDHESGRSYADITDSIEEDVPEGGDGDYDIDHFVLSHDDRDHNKYIENLQGDPDIEVHNWYRPPVPDDSHLSSNADQVADWTIVTRGDDIDFGGGLVSADVRHPMDASSSDRICPTDDDATDCNSVILRVNYSTHSFLFTGDVKTPHIRELIDRSVVQFGGADVVKLPHHGTDSSYNRTMLKSIQYTAVVSNNDDSSPPSSSPGGKVFRVLEQNDVMTYWTATHEDIVFKVEDGRLGVVAESEDGDDLDSEVPPVPDFLISELPSSERAEATG